jgi:UDP-glucose 4-epimerase
MSDSSVLITGGAGYIGSHIAAALSNNDINVVIYDNLSNSCETVISSLERVCAKPIVFVNGDVRDCECLCNVLRSHCVTSVIHLAGLKSVGESAAVPIEYYENNVQGTICLIRAMLAMDVKTMVFSSSATVYGEPQYLPIDEGHPARPTNPYGRSKLQVEQILEDLALSDPAWRIICLRYFNPVGAHDSGLLGESPLGIPGNLMPLIVQVAAAERDVLDVFGNDYPTHDGTGIRDYVHVMDIAEGHVCALDYLADNPGWHVINLGRGEGYSVLEIAKTFEKVNGCPIPYRIVSRRAGDVAISYAKVERAAQQLHWQARRTLEEMCATSWRYRLSKWPLIAAQ